MLLSPPTRKFRLPAFVPELQHSATDGHEFSSIFRALIFTRIIEGSSQFLRNFHHDYGTKDVINKADNEVLNSSSNSPLAQYHSLLAHWWGCCSKRGLLCLQCRRHQSVRHVTMILRNGRHSSETCHRKMDFSLKKKLTLTTKNAVNFFLSLRTLMEESHTSLDRKVRHEAWVRFTHALYVTHKRMLKLRCHDVWIHLPVKSLEHIELILKQSLRGPREGQSVHCLGYWLENSGFKSRQDQEIFSPKRPDRLWGSYNPLFYGNRKFFCRR